MHDVAVPLDSETLGDGHAARLGHTTDIVAAQIEQHQVLRPLFRVGQQRLFGEPIFGLRRTARPRTGNRTDRDLALAHADEDFRARTDDREAGHIEEIQEGRRVDPAQRPVKGHGR